MNKNTKDQRPNFLVIMTDQQRGDCLGIEEHSVLQTPNMDSIAGRGIRFTRAYSTCPVCIPARRSFISGQFPSTHGMVGYQEGVEWDPPTTLPGELSNSGYHTCWVGRTLHLHPERKRYGFEHMVITPDCREWVTRYGPEGSGGYYGAGPMHNDWTARPFHMDEMYHDTNWTVNEALRFLRSYRDPSCPYFLGVSFIAPHPPFIPPVFYFNRYYHMELPSPAIGNWAMPPARNGAGMDVHSPWINLQGEALRSMLAGYFGLINHIDDQIRRLLNPVDGIDRNTVVVFTSDHGEMLGDHYLFRKSLPYEGSARIPLLIRPIETMELPKGKVINAPVCLEDIMPTILDMAGIDIPESVDGKSMLPLLNGQEAEWRPFLHIEHAPKFHALTDGKEKYIWSADTGSEQLFDLINDPRECHDLAPLPEKAEKLSMWRSRLIKQLDNRPEGFANGEKLIPGQSYKTLMAR